MATAAFWDAIRQSVGALEEELELGDFPLTVNLSDVVAEARSITPSPEAEQLAAVIASLDAIAMVPQPPRNTPRPPAYSPTAFPEAYLLINLLEGKLLVGAAETKLCSLEAGLGSMRNSREPEDGHELG